MDKNDFKYLSLEFQSKWLDLVRQKILDFYEYIKRIIIIEKQLTKKEKFYSSLTGKTNSEKRLWWCS